MTRPTLNIVGGGKAARALARLWTQAEVFDIGSVCNRSLRSARGAVEFIGSGRAVADIEAMPAADVWLIGCPDQAIGGASRKLGRGGRIGAGNTVFHLSGVLSASAIEGVPGRRASFHPARSFADPHRACAEFEGTLVAIQGDDEACGELGRWARQIGAEPILVSASAKRLYHAASAVASNYLITLVDAATGIYRKAGIAEHIARRLALSLARGAIDNAERLDTPDALTGPIARGDVATVAAHLAALPTEHQEMYRALGRMTVELARSAGRLDRTTADAMLRVLRGE